MSLLDILTVILYGSYDIVSPSEPKSEVTSVKKTVTASGHLKYLTNVLIALVYEIKLNLAIRIPCDLQD